MNRAKWTDAAEIHLIVVEKEYFAKIIIMFL